MSVVKCGCGHYICTIYDKYEEIDGKYVCHRCLKKIAEDKAKAESEEQKPN